MCSCSCVQNRLPKLNCTLYKRQVWVKLKWATSLFNEKCRDTKIHYSFREDISKLKLTEEKESQPKCISSKMVCMMFCSPPLTLLIHYYHISLCLYSCICIHFLLLEYVNNFFFLVYNDTSTPLLLFLSSHMLTIPKCTFLNRNESNSMLLYVKLNFNSKCEWKCMYSFLFLSFSSQW